MSSFASDVPDGVSLPQQERSRASFERVLEAGTALLGEEGYDGFTLAGVSRRAGVSIGSIYARVKSKDDLFHVLQDRFMTAAEADDMLARPGPWDGVPGPELVSNVVAALGDTFQRNAPLLRVFMHRGIVDEVVAQRSSRGVTVFAERVARLLLARRDEIAHDDPDLAVGVAFRMAWGTLARQVMYGPAFGARREVAWDTLVAELGHACGAYLFGSEPRSVGRSERR